MEEFFNPFFNPLLGGGDSSNKSDGVHAEDAIMIYDGVNAGFVSKTEEVEE